MNAGLQGHASFRDQAFRICHAGREASFEERFDLPPHRNATITAEGARSEEPDAT